MIPAPRIEVVPQGDRNCMSKLYPYVGPAAIKARVACRPAGTRISSAADLLDWVRGTGEHPGHDGLVAATFVIDAGGDLLLADRRSEHVGCAGGGPVLSAGEMFFRVNGEEIEAVATRSAGSGTSRKTAGSSVELRGARPPNPRHQVDAFRIPDRGGRHLPPSRHRDDVRPPIDAGEPQ
jgi:hypothetical protein